MHVRSIAVAGCAPPCAFTARDTSAAIAPGDSLVINVMYVQSSEARDVDTLLVDVDAPCQLLLPVVMTGTTSALPVVHVCADSMAPTVSGDHVLMQLQLLDTVPASPGQIITLHLLYDARAMYPGQLISHGCAVAATSIGAGDLMLTFVSCASPILPGRICDVDFIALVSSGDTVRGMVTVSDIDFSPNVASGVGCAAPFTVLPPCALHGVIAVSHLLIGRPFPEPAVDAAYLPVSIPKDRTMVTTLRVSDIYGRVVRDCSASITSGAGTIAIDASGLPSGVYTIIAEDGETRIARPLVITR